jgi:predicted ferric reductase
VTRGHGKHSRRIRPTAGWVLALLTVGMLAAVGLGVMLPEPSKAFDLALVARVSGMAAGYGAPVMLLLMSRMPVLERVVGADKLARWHAIAGPLVIALAVLHAVAALVDWAGVRGTGLWSAWLEMVSWPGLLIAALGTELLILVGIASARWIRRRLSYETWHVFHLLGYLAVGLGFTHQLAGPALAGNRALQIAWSLLYTYTFAVVLRYRVVQPLHQLWRHRLHVERVVRESDDVVSVVMRGNHLDELRAEPGQFFRWRFLTLAHWRSAFPFSLSAPPTGNRLRITIKAVGAGSRSLQDLKPGDLVLAEGPYGALTERRRRRAKVLMIAGGVGITPIRVLFETLDLPGEDMTLIYRAPREADLVLKHELDEVARRKGSRVIYLTGPSTDPANQLTAHRLHSLVDALRDHDIYLCASARLSAAIRESLLSSGFPRRQLHEERFAFGP